MSVWSKYFPAINQGGYLILNARKIDEDFSTSLVYVCRSIEEKFKDCNYGEFKTKVADVVIEEISQIQKRYNEIINNNELDKILDEGRDFTRKIAKKKYEDMKYKMGFRR